MLLVDTNVWIDFFKGKKECQKLAQLLISNEILIHPFVISELVIGGLKKEIQLKMEKMKQVEVVSEEKIRQFILKENLVGKGLGLVDIHLLASARLTPCQIWTFDSFLKTASNQIL